MAKAKTVYICRECGAEARQWLGKCPDCGVYGSLQEEIREKESSAGVSRTWHQKPSTHSKSAAPIPRTAIKFSEIDTGRQMRFGSGFGELDRVLGGGLVPGSLVLIGGDPGIGKSTLLLQVAYQLSADLPRILYVSAEESGQQIKLRGDRLRSADQNPEENLYILTETGLETILGELETLRPQVAVIDSIQTLYYSALGSAPGSVSQVRECTSALMQVAKRENITLFIVGHVTKEGAIAGPRVLEHLVDTVLYFEGDRYASHRLLRSVKKSLRSDP
ncbi:AAA family ATPase [Picosynechococcus sp. NKBG15041c]|uniref:AAA family ATPase n=1 Tax=Picosynechococcus sp. NKBG15041c TaxID=1407650 RepID=UPI0003FC2216